MSTSFTADVGSDGYKLVFSTDVKENIEYMISAARDCIDNKPIQKQIDRLKLENMQLKQRMKLEKCISEMISAGGNK